METVSRDGVRFDGYLHQYRRTAACRFKLDGLKYTVEGLSLPGGFRDGDLVHTKRKRHQARGART